MIAVLITVAFLVGMLARRLGLPPMVGFLAAGFALRGAGFEGSDQLGLIADFGVTLLLFTIGLKLKVRSLARPEVWAGTSLHMGATMVVLAGVGLLLGMLGLPLFRELDVKTALVLGFALSFSSTVFAAKAFEERAELATRHATAAIGILIMQDVIAVVFLTVTSGKVPAVWALALLLLPFLLPKALGYFGVLCAFRLRARPSFLAGLGLANFSEFGLIVGSVAVTSGWLSGEWLVAIAVLVALSFVVAAPLNAHPSLLFGRFGTRLKKLERRSFLAEDAPIACGTPEAVVFGMGRLGIGVYDWLVKEKGLAVIGVDSCPETVTEQCREGRTVVLGDGTDPGFWERVDAAMEPKLVYVATRDFRATRRIAERLLAFNDKAKITALAQHEDQAEELRAMGVRSVYDLYREAGTAFAEDSWEAMDKHDPANSS
jgi:Kef-type K+ transport system membrane component KefB